MKRRININVKNQDKRSINVEDLEKKVQHALGHQDNACKCDRGADSTQACTEPTQGCLCGKKKTVDTLRDWLRKRNQVQEPSTFMDEIHEAERLGNPQSTQDLNTVEKQWLDDASDRADSRRSVDAEDQNLSTHYRPGESLDARTQANSEILWGDNNKPIAGENYQSLAKQFEQSRKIVDALTGRKHPSFKEEYEELQKKHDTLRNLDKIVGKEEEPKKEEPKKNPYNKKVVSDYEFVNHPQHYNNYDMEVIDMMIKLFGIHETISFCKLNAFKYRMRAGTKPGESAEKDIQKEKWYLEKAEELESTLF